MDTELEFHELGPPEGPDDDAGEASAVALAGVAAASSAVTEGPALASPQGYDGDGVDVRGGGDVSSVALSPVPADGGPAAAVPVEPSNLEIIKMFVPTR